MMDMGRGEDRCKRKEDGEQAGAGGGGNGCGIRKRLIWAVAALKNA